MILADKIIRLRKRNGWSQEELAEKMNVSRQAVSKWEGAQTVPDLEKILCLARLFGVTTDYLLKDELEEEEFTSDETTNVRKVSLSDAHEFLAWRRVASIRIAIATLLCILSPIPLILLAALAELQGEAAGPILGLVILLAIVAGAVGIFVSTGLKNAPYEFLEKEPFECEYGVTGMVRERQKAYRTVYVRSNVLATVLCVLSPIPLLCCDFIHNEFLALLLLSAMIAIVGVGVFLFIVVGVRQASMQRLLREGEFSEKEKGKNRTRETVETVYWLLATAIYLGWSFLSNDWNITWVVWPIAAVLSVGVTLICNLLVKDER
ncbi:MAG: helix-turn-helix transcriptional regulator [Clostridia bacterium]|nr:helix-turn-helix transcriptional regulator [Clostridia bacterium]